MYFSNICLELQMEIEQKDVVNYLRRKEMKLPAIVAELSAVYHEDAFYENRVKYWLHEITSHRSDLSGQPSSGRPSLEDIDTRIRQVLEAERWPSVRTAAEFLKIPASTVHLHPNTFLNMKSRHFKWVPLFVDDALRVKRWEDDRELLDVLDAQNKCHVRDLITGSETRTYLDVKLGTNWLPADAELPVRV
jgi:hypothetical protein